MNMKKITIPFLGLCLLLASCSQDDMPNQENADGALRQVTLSATLPDGMISRAAADDTDPAPTRCYVQILGTDGGILSGDLSDVKQMVAANGSFSLTVTLDPSRTYNFLFWADNASGETAPTSLTNVSYRPDGTVIAFADKLEDQGYVSGGINATLEHVVTRISVKTTAAVTIDDTHRLTVKAPCYTTYDVSAMQSGNPGNELTYPFSNGTFAAGDHVGHFYVLGNESGTAGTTVTLQYEGAAGNPGVVFSNVPLKPNYHITLSGDIANSGLVQGNITATAADGWIENDQDILGYTVSADGQTYTALTADGLKNIAKLVNEEGKTDIDITLDTDLDLTGEWTPIGTDNSNSYKGTFDGKDKTITGLAVTGSNKYAGLFGYIGEGGTVKDVTLEEVQIATTDSYGYAGGVAGYSYDGKIENCSVSGSVSGTMFAGGVVGYQYGGSITECNSSATVKGVNYAGGMAGSTNNSASLTGCYATGSVSVANNITTDAFAGGVVGYNGGGTLTACYATGSVSGSGTIYVGGVTGENTDGTLIACYHAKGTVSCPAGTTGGVVGWNYKAIYGPVITACYWGGNGQAQGIGNDEAGTGGTTQVDGTNVKWENTIDPMNTALKSAGSALRYSLGVEGLPALE